MDLSKLKAFADDKMNVAKMMFHVFDRAENIVGKGENSGYQHFLLFPHCFLTNSCIPCVSQLLGCGSEVSCPRTLPWFTETSRQALWQTNIIDLFIVHHIWILRMSLDFFFLGGGGEGVKFTVSVKALTGVLNHIQ